MATTFTHAQRAEREKQVRKLLDRGKGMTAIAAEFGITKQAVWQFCAVRGWLDDAKANDAKIKAERVKSRGKTRKSDKSGLDERNALA